MSTMQHTSLLPRFNACAIQSNCVSSNLFCLWQVHIPSVDAESREWWSNSEAEDMFNLWLHDETTVMFRSSSWGNLQMAKRATDRYFYSNFVLHYITAIYLTLSLQYSQRLVDVLQTFSTSCNRSLVAYKTAAFNVI